MQASLQWLSDILLAIAAIYVAWNGLRAHRKERQAAHEVDAGKKEALLEDARTLYFSASISKMWVLLFILSGALVKIGIGVWAAARYVASVGPA